MSCFFCGTIIRVTYGVLGTATHGLYLDFFLAKSHYILSDCALCRTPHLTWVFTQVHAGSCLLRMSTPALVNLAPKYALGTPCLSLGPLQGEIIRFSHDITLHKLVRPSDSVQKGVCDMNSFASMWYIRLSIFLSMSSSSLFCYPLHFIKLQEICTTCMI